MGVSGGNTSKLELPSQFMALSVSNDPSWAFCGSSMSLKHFTTQIHATSSFYTVNWDHLYASRVGSPSALAWAPSVDHFPVKWVPSLKIFIGCFTDPQKFWNPLDYMYKNLCNVRIPLFSTFVKKWGNAKAKTLARSASRSSTVMITMSSELMNNDGYKLSIRSTSALDTLMRVRSEQSAPMHFLGYCIATTICSRHASQAIILNSFWAMSQSRGDCEQAPG